MPALQVTLTDDNTAKLSDLARLTGKTPEMLANEAVEKFSASATQSLQDDADEAEKFQRWRAALLQVAGMWADRDDLPDFDELRKSWDRNVWSR